MMYFELLLKDTFLNDWYKACNVCDIEFAVINKDNDFLGGLKDGYCKCYNED